jgi:hypothetical protein
MSSNAAIIWPRCLRYNIAPMQAFEIKQQLDQLAEKLAQMRGYL